MQITFTKLTESDFPLLLKWLEMPHIKPWWTPEVSYTLASVNEKYATYVNGYKLVKDRNGQVFEKPIHAYIMHCENQPIGYIQLYNAYDFESEKKAPFRGLPKSLGAIDIMIGEKAYLGKGFGSLALQQFLNENEYARSYLSIFVDPNPNNIHAIKAYTKVGFEKVLANAPLDECWMVKRLFKVKLSEDE